MHSDDEQDGTLGRARTDALLSWVPDTPDTHWLFHKVHAGAVAANRLWGFDISAPMQSMQLCRYRPGGKYDWHIDLGTGPMALRKLTIVVQLTPIETGNLEIMPLGPLNLQMGDVAAFPSFMLHRATPANGERWSLTSWLLGPSPFR